MDSILLLKIGSEGGYIEIYQEGENYIYHSDESMMKEFFPEEEWGDIEFEKRESYSSFDDAISRINPRLFLYGVITFIHPDYEKKIESHLPPKCNNLEYVKRLIFLDREESSIYNKKIESYVKLPEEYQKIDTLPEDPENAVAYGLMTEKANCILTIYPIDSASAMNYDNIAELIEGIHNTITEKQALIEVENGRTYHHKYSYIYSIVKNLKESKGVQYFVLLHIDCIKQTLCVKAFFDEQGRTGERDALIYAKLQSEGTLEHIGRIEKWFIDPYDHNFKRNYLMNLSELKEFDVMFPNHPLSLARSLIKYITSHI